MPLDAAAIAAGCGGELRSADQLCRRELERFKAALSTDAAITVGCTQEAPLFREVAAEAGAEERLAFANIRENAGWSANARDAGPKMAALLAAAAEPAHAVQFVAMESRGVALVYGRDATAIEAARQLADHLDITVLLTRPGDDRAAAGDGVPGAEGHDRRRNGTSRRVLVAHRRLRAARSLVARAPRVRAGARRRDLDLRPRPRSVGQFPAVSGARAAERLSPRRSARRRGRRAPDLRGLAPRRHLRQAEIRQLLRSFVRAFPLADHGLHALPRALPDGRHHAGRRPCRDRPLCLRRLRLLRRRLPDRRRDLRGAGCPPPAAQPAHAALGVPRRRGRQSGPPVPRWRPWRAPDRRPRPLRPGAARKRHPGRGQRGDADRTGDDRRRLRLWGDGRAPSPAGEGEARPFGASPDAGARERGACGARLRRRRRPDGRDRRPGCAPLGARPGTRRHSGADTGELPPRGLETRPPRALVPRAPSRGARAGARRRDRASGRRALRRARLQRRRLHALPCLRQRLPDARR